MLGTYPWEHVISGSVWSTVYVDSRTGPKSMPSSYEFWANYLVYGFAVIEDKFNVSRKFTSRFTSRVREVEVVGYPKNVDFSQLSESTRTFFR